MIKTKDQPITAITRTLIAPRTPKKPRITDKQPDEACIAMSPFVNDGRISIAYNGRVDKGGGEKNGEI